MIKILQVILNGIFRIYSKIVYGIKITGKENIPKDGPILFCGNHKSLLDPLLITAFTSRKMRFLAKNEINNIFLRPILKIYKTIFVKRDSKDITAIKESLKTLKSGNCIAIFPEGTRNGLEKNNGQMKNGATYLAVKTGAKIVPIGIKGDMKPFHKIVLNYGKPIDYAEFSKEKMTEELENKLTENLKDKIIELTK